MKGQTQALTAVLITSVTIGAVATAYVWGAPLLEKRQSMAELEKTERQVAKLHQELLSVARSGASTTATVELNIPDGRVEVHDEGDYVDIYTQATRAPYPTDTWTLLRGDTLQNLTIGSGSYASAGKDLPGVLAVKTVAGAGNAVVQYRIEFRNMDRDSLTGASLTRVDLRTTGRTASRGSTTISITNEGTNTDTVKVETGETLSRKNTILDLDLQ